MHLITTPRGSRIICMIYVTDTFIFYHCFQDDAFEPFEKTAEQELNKENKAVLNLPSAVHTNPAKKMCK